MVKKSSSVEKSALKILKKWEKMRKFCLSEKLFKIFEKSVKFFLE